MTVSGQIDLVKLMEALIERGTDFMEYSFHDDSLHFDDDAFRRVFYECTVKAFGARVSSDDGKISRTAMEQTAFEMYGVLPRDRR